MYYDYAMAAPLMIKDKNVADMDVLILGMGTGTYATQCSRYLGDMNIEGVEIDEKITKLSRQYFSLPQSVPVTTYDGRAFLNSSDNKDIINVLSANTAALNNRELKNMMARVVSNIDQYDKGNYVLTDDKAPVELLGMQVIDELIKDEVSYYKDIYKSDGIKGLLNSF